MLCRDESILYIYIKLHVICIQTAYGLNSLSPHRSPVDLSFERFGTRASVPDRKSRALLIFRQQSFLEAAPKDQ